MKIRLEVFYNLTSPDGSENGSIIFFHIAKNTARETAMSFSDLLERRQLICRQSCTHHRETPSYRLLLHFAQALQSIMQRRNFWTSVNKNQSPSRHVTAVWSQKGQKPLMFFILFAKWRQTLLFSHNLLRMDMTPCLQLQAMTRLSES